MLTKGRITNATMLTKESNVQFRIVVGITFSFVYAFWLANIAAKVGQYVSEALLRKVS